MKISLVNLFSILFVISLVSSVILPAYAEVTSFQTNAGFYKGGNQIIFSGKTASGDSQNVYIVIYGPNNFALLASGTTDNANNFQIMVDTSTSNNQKNFSVKGIYNATAFVMNKATGKTITFIFSPDGSSITPSSPVSLTATSFSSTEIDLSWSTPTMNGGSPVTGYKIERNDGNGFSAIQNTLTLTYQDAGLTPSKQYSYRISAINSAGISSVSSTASATTSTMSTTTVTLKVKSANLSGNPIQGLWTVIKSKGIVVAKGYTALAFAATPGIPYTITVSNYQNYVFNHWNNASTNPTRTVTLTQSLNVMAYYNN